MNQYFVYILYCSDDSYYIGVTNNIDRRLNEHQSGYNIDSYTYSRRPLQLVFTQSFTDINEAILFEKRLKKWSKSKKQALIESDWEGLSKLARKKNFKR